MEKTEFLKLTDLDKVKHVIEESLKEHKKYKTDYWKGSAFMGESVLQTIEQVKNLSLAAVNQRSELYFSFMEEYNALMGESEHQILKEEVVVLLAKYCG